MLHPCGPERELCGREDLLCYIEFIKLGVHDHEYDEDSINKSIHHHKISTKVMSLNVGMMKKGNWYINMKWVYQHEAEKSVEKYHNFATNKSHCFSYYRFQNDAFLQRMQQYSAST